MIIGRLFSPIVFATLLFFLKIDAEQHNHIKLHCSSTSSNHKSNYLTPNTQKIKFSKWMYLSTFTLFNMPLLMSSTFSYYVYMQLHDINASHEITLTFIHTSTTLLYPLPINHFHFWCICHVCASSSTFSVDTLNTASALHFILTICLCVRAAYFFFSVDVV